MTPTKPTNPKHNTGDVELRDYEQYIHWQFVALLRGLRLSANLSPAQEQLIKSKAQLIAATIDEDLAAKELDAYGRGFNEGFDRGTTAIDPPNTGDVEQSVRQCFVDTEMERVDDDLTLFDTDATVAKLVALIAVREAEARRTGRTEVLREVIANPNRRGYYLELLNNELKAARLTQRPKARKELRNEEEVYRQP